MDLHEQRPFFSVITETAPAVLRGGVPLLHSLTLAVGDGLANVHQPGSENLQIELEYFLFDNACLFSWTRLTWVDPDLLGLGSPQPEPAAHPQPSCNKIRLHILLVQIRKNDQ